MVLLAFAAAAHDAHHESRRLGGVVTAGQPLLVHAQSQPTAVHDSQHISSGVVRAVSPPASSDAPLAAAFESSCTGVHTGGKPGLPAKDGSRCKAFRESRPFADFASLFVGTSKAAPYPLSEAELSRAWFSRGKHLSRLDCFLRRVASGREAKVAVLGGSMTCGNLAYRKFMPKGTRWTDVWQQQLQRLYSDRVTVVNLCAWWGGYRELYSSLGLGERVSRLGTTRAERVRPVGR